MDSAQARYREKNREALRYKNRLAMAERRADPDKRASLLASQQRTYFRSKYGLELEQLESMWEDQGRCCALCDRLAPAPHHKVGKPTERLCVDHCHDRNQVRGLLCYDCNTSLGKLGDSPDRLQRALTYVGG
jgi:hypothetical protein